MDLSFFLVEKNKNILQLYAIRVFAEKMEFNLKKKEFARFCREKKKKKMKYAERWILKEARFLRI